VLVRSWNVFHGRTQPPGHDDHLEGAVRLASGDAPAVLCLQEVPVWALARLAEWSGMTALGDVTRPATFGPLPIPAELGRRLTELAPPIARSAFSGQGNAILLDPGLRVLSRRRIVLNDRRFRRAQARRLGLDLVTRLAWAKERRVCQAARIALPDGRTALVANLHATSLASCRRLTDAELLRAACFADALAEPGDVLVLAGDFNATPERSRTLAELTGPLWGFSAAGPGIDHVLVRGADVSPLHVWPEERRRLGGRLLSDHAPVELVVS